MIKDVLQSIANVEIYPIIALALFIASFVAITLQTILMDKKELARISRLPLDDSDMAENETKAGGE